MSTSYGLVEVKVQVGVMTTVAIVTVHAVNEAAYTSVGKTILIFPPISIAAYGVILKVYLAPVAYATTLSEATVAVKAFTVGV